MFRFSCAMANTLNIPKAHLAIGLSLPLAVLLGYFLAEPMDLGNLAVVVLVLVVLAIPLMLRWYYPALVLLWNAAITPAFLPGRPNLWALVAIIGLVIAVFSRAVTKNVRFEVEPSIIKPLLILTGVVIATGLLTGGFGLRMLGAGQYGGKHYFYFLAAVAGYFVFTTRRILPDQAGLYVAMYFLAGLSSAISILAGLGGAKLQYLWLLFPPALSMLEPSLGGPLMAGPESMLRVSELALTATALYGYLLARFGIRGVLDLTRPWRLLLLALAVGGGMMSGYRSFTVLFAVLFAVLFFLEGLHRTRIALVFLVVMLLGGAVVLPQAEKLPREVQRALSFLPGRFDFDVQRGAMASTDWRVDMWRRVLPEVPQALFRGRGWGVDAREFFSAVEIINREDRYASVIFSGNFHNGPLSVLIPFGLYGVIAFVWFLAAGLRVLHRNWKFGSPALHRVNTLLLAAFVAHTIVFCVVYGALETDMAIFTGLLGLSVALNGAVPAPAESAATGVELGTEYIKA
jgi:hypothetical protein